MSEPMLKAIASAAKQTAKRPTPAAGAKSLAQKHQA